MEQAAVLRRAADADSRELILGTGVEIERSVAIWNNRLLISTPVPRITTVEVSANFLLVFAPTLLPRITDIHFNVELSSSWRRQYLNRSFLIFG